MATNDFFEKDIILKILWRHFQKLMKKSQQEFANEIWKTQSYVNWVLNWRLHATKSQLLEFALALWMTEKEYEELIKQAKKEEFKQTTWQDLNLIPECDLNLLEDIDFEKWIDIVFKKEFWKDISEEDKKTIINFIKLIGKK